MAARSTARGSAALILVLAAGCGSAEADRAQGRATTTVELADTPEAAALDVDASMNSDGRQGRFACFSAPDGETVVLMRTEGEPVATSRREGDHWVVDLASSSTELASRAYQVDRRAGGYCVSAIRTPTGPTGGPMSTP